MLNEKKTKRIKELLDVVEKTAFKGNEKELQGAMDDFNNYLDKLPEKEREYAFVESLHVFREITKQVNLKKEAVVDLMDDANQKNNANKVYSKY